MGALALVTDKSTPTPFGVWLKERRAAKGLSQEQLGKAADCSGAYVSGLERGADKSKPAAEIVDAWARALEVPENEARRIAGHPPILTTQEQAERVILDYYEGASEPSREIMRAVLKTIYEVDKRREVTEESAAQKEDAQAEAQAGKWPRAKGSKKKDPKNARHR
jgi:transcriptional regulator with XRE-family HTH domain